MAFEEAIRSISLQADASLAVWTSVPGQPGSAAPNGGKQYRFVKVTDEVVVGVLQNKPQVTGQAATVAIRGVSKVIAGGTVAAGDAVKVDSEGRGVAATLPADASLVVGVAFTGGAVGEVISVLLQVA